MYYASKKRRRRSPCLAMLACNIHDYLATRDVALQIGAGESPTSECTSCQSSLLCKQQSSTKAAPKQHQSKFETGCNLPCFRGALCASLSLPVFLTAGSVARLLQMRPGHLYAASLQDVSPGLRRFLPLQHRSRADKVFGDPCPRSPFILNMHTSIQEGGGRRRGCVCSGLQAGRPRRSAVLSEDSAAGVF